MKSAIALLCVVALMHSAAVAGDNQNYEPCQKMRYTEGHPKCGQKQDNVSSATDQDKKQVDQDYRSMEQSIQREKDYPTADTIPATVQSETQSIFVNSMTSGAVQAVYQTPNKGRVQLNLWNSKEDILIHIDARVDWYGWNNTLIVNSKAANRPWGKPVHPKGFPFPCCGFVTTITLHVKITDSAFIISANGIKIVKYLYRKKLHPPVDIVEYVFQDTGASKKAKLESLLADY